MHVTTLNESMISTKYYCKETLQKTISVKVPLWGVLRSYFTCRIVPGSQRGRWILHQSRFLSGSLQVLEWGFSCLINWLRILLQALMYLKWGFRTNMCCGDCGLHVDIKDPVVTLPHNKTQGRKPTLTSRCNYSLPPTVSIFLTFRKNIRVYLQGVLALEEE